MKNKIIAYFKGFLIGLGMLIPGLSGGTVAVFLNVFEDILEAVSEAFTHTLKSIKTILPIAMGAITSVLIFSKLIEAFCVSFPIISKYLFCIIAIISCLIFAKEKIGFDTAIKQIIWIISGVAIALITSIIISIYNLNFSHAGFMVLFLIGILLSLALILPAISFSYMMLFFGIYENTLNAISNFKLDYLSPLCVGIAFGGYIFSKILLKLLNAYTKQTYCFVLGFVIMSIADILC